MRKDHKGQRQKNLTQRRKGAKIQDKDFGEAITLDAHPAGLYRNQRFTHLGKDSPGTETLKQDLREATEISVGSVSFCSKSVSLCFFA
jgi:hypothetical protein